jgi:general secretion pathway protein G
VELLVVIAIISLLAAMLFPVFASARAKAQEITCNSNLRQQGMALRMYIQDYDEFYPWAVDPTDKYTPQIWNAYPSFQSQIPGMPFLYQVLAPYLKSPELNHCPSDTGYTVEDFTGFPLDATPSSYSKYGTSYNYRTEISFLHLSDAAMSNPSGVNVLMDADGSWHGGYSNSDRRYNVLFADGHIKLNTRAQMNELWNTPLQ